MYKFKEVVQCKKCGKIYQDSMPGICGKCGARIGKEFPINPFPTSYFDLMKNKQAEEYFMLTENCRKVIARRKFFKWEIKEGED